MAKGKRGAEAWGRSAGEVPEWVRDAEVLVACCLASPSVPQPAISGFGFESVKEAACADLLRRFAAPLRVADVGEVRIVSMLDALVFVHDWARRHVCVGAWQADGTVAINTLNRVLHPTVAARPYLILAVPGVKVLHVPAVMPALVQVHQSHHLIDREPDGSRPARSAGQSIRSVHPPRSAQRNAGNYVPTSPATPPLPLASAASPAILHTLLRITSSGSTVAKPSGSRALP